MPFRERVKRALGRNSSVSEGDPLKASKTKESTEDAGLKPKYRAPVDPEHKARLESFSFTNSWRRKSAQSDHSPFGSRQPSRNNSLSADPRKIFGAGGRGKSHVGPVMESADDSTNTANVGGTRHHSVGTPSGPSESTNDGSIEADTEAGAPERPETIASDHLPFAEADITKALTKSASRRPES